MRWMIGFMMAICFSAPGWALNLGDISDQEATGGLKDALIQGAASAVGKLGVADGFFKNKKVKIPLPDSLEKAKSVMRMFGMGKQADELVLRMNRAAEAAVPEAKVLLVDAVKQMSVSDVKNILTGGDDAATRYFKKVTSGPLAEKFLPIVTRATENVQLAQQYNEYAGSALKYGLMKKEQANIEQYVTQKTLDGLFFMMAEEERAIRRDPLGQANSLVKKVFGALGK